MFFQDVLLVVLVLLGVGGVVCRFEPYPRYKREVPKEKPAPPT
jgi:hypothetical protein